MTIVETVLKVGTNALINLDDKPGRYVGLLCLGVMSRKSTIA